VCPCAWIGHIAGRLTAAFDLKDITIERAKVFAILLQIKGLGVELDQSSLSRDKAPKKHARLLPVWLTLANDGFNV
jgi:hypothetical protein